MKPGKCCACSSSESCRRPLNRRGRIPHQILRPGPGNAVAIAGHEESSAADETGYPLQMAVNSKIEWTDATWNPVRGCTKISPGCTHCYAETFAERFRGVPGHPYEQGFDLRFVPEKLLEPLRWRSARMVFVNSMSDLFHEDVPDDYVCRVAEIMDQADWHTYQVLTKRVDRMAHLLQTKLRFAAERSHIWWGVSVENRQHGLPRVRHLQSTPARMRFLSVEPLLESLGMINLHGIHWVIVGGESGRGARPMKAEWVLELRDQCQREGVAFFFKQWGGFNKARTGRTLAGQTYDEFPASTRRPFPDTATLAALRERLASSATPWSPSVRHLR